MEFKRVNYPSEDFFHFGDGVKVPDDVIENWVNEGIESVKKQLEEGVDSPYSLRATGDSIVIVFFSQDCEEDMYDGSNYFEVIVAKNYEEASFFIEDIRTDKVNETVCTNLICPFKEMCQRSVLNTPSDLENVNLKRFEQNKKTGFCPDFIHKGGNG